VCVCVYSDFNDKFSLLFRYKNKNILTAATCEIDFFLNIAKYIICKKIIGHSRQLYAHTQLCKYYNDIDKYLFIC